MSCEHWKTCRTCPSPALADTLRAEEDKQRGRAEKAETHVEHLRATIARMVELGEKAVAPRDAILALVDIGKAWLKPMPEVTPPSVCTVTPNKTSEDDDGGHVGREGDPLSDPRPPAGRPGSEESASMFTKRADEEEKDDADGRAGVVPEVSETAQGEAWRMGRDDHGLVPDPEGVPRRDAPRDHAKPHADLTGYRPSDARSDGIVNAKGCRITHPINWSCSMGTPGCVLTGHGDNVLADLATLFAKRSDKAIAAEAGEHTPGPWGLRGVQIRANDGRGQHVATYQIGRADGLLIAAAPRMLAVLQDIAASEYRHESSCASKRQVPEACDCDLAPFASGVCSDSPEASREDR